MNIINSISIHKKSGSTLPDNNSKKVIEYFKTDNNLKNYFKNQKNKLDMALKLNLLYDSYQNNNNIISKDIKKKKYKSRKGTKKNL